MQNDFDSATQAAQKVGAKAKAGADAVRDDVRRTAEDVQEQLASAAENTKEQVGEVAESVKARAHAMAEDRKATGAEQLSGLARAINLAADELQDELPEAAGYVREAAARVDNVSTMIRERSIEDLIHEANDFARSNAVAFFGISVVAGFALARFLKSGAPSHSEHMSAAHHSSQAQPHSASEAASAPPERFAAIPSSQF